MAAVVGQGVFSLLCLCVEGGEEVSCNDCHLVAATIFPLVRRIPVFLELIPYSPVHTRLLSARACLRQHNGQSAEPLATAGVIPWLYPSANFHRQAATDEQQTVPIAYQLHRDVRRRSFHSDAEEQHTQDRTYATITLLNAKYSLYFSATEFHRQPSSDEQEPAPAAHRHLHRYFCCMDAYLVAARHIHGRIPPPFSFQSST